MSTDGTASNPDVECLFEEPFVDNGPSSQTVEPELTGVIRVLHRKDLGKFKDTSFPPFVINRSFTVSMMPLMQLTRRHIGELQVQSHCKGSFVILRILEDIIEKECITTVVEDEHGAGAQFSLYNFSVYTPEYLRELMSVGTVFVLKEPFCAWNYKGIYHLSTESPSDMVFIYDRPDILDMTSSIEWTSDIRDTLHQHMIPASAQEWTNNGLIFREARKHELASRCYYLALYDMERYGVEDQVLRLRLYSELCETCFGVGFYEKAVTFAEMILVDNQQPPNRLALELATVSSYKIGRYARAGEFAQLGVDAYPEYEHFGTYLNASRLRVMESTTASFDLIEMFRVGFSDSAAPIECSDYTGPVRIVQIEGKGRGVVATRDIAPGTLLAVSKALAFTWNTRGRDNHCWEDLVLQLSRVIILNPQTFGPIIYDLFDGLAAQGPVIVFCDPGTMLEPILDLRKLKYIVINNAIGDNKAMHKFSTTLLKYSDRNMGSGLYLLASYFNHSCVPNTSVHEFNNVLWIRAVKPVLVGEELCIPYISYEFPYFTRKEFCKLRGFRCKCQFCQSCQDMLEPDGNIQKEVLARQENIFSDIVQNGAVFTPALIENIRSLELQMAVTFRNPVDFAAQAAQANIHALRATAYSMPSCTLPDKLKKQVQCHWMVLNCLGHDPAQMVSDVQHGGTLIAPNAIVDDNVLHSASRLVYLFNALNQNIMMRTWVRILMALERIYSGGDVRVLMLQYEFIDYLLYDD